MRSPGPTAAAASPLLTARPAISARQAVHRVVACGGGLRPQPPNALQRSSVARAVLRCACMLRQLCKEVCAPSETCDAVACVLGRSIGLSGGRRQESFELAIVDPCWKSYGQHRMSLQLTLAAHTMTVAPAIAAFAAAGNDVDALEQAIEQASYLDATPGEDRQKLRGSLRSLRFHDNAPLRTIEVAIVMVSAPRKR